MIPAAKSVASKSASPVQEAFPSLSRLVFGPDALAAFPVLRITPLDNGKAGFVLSKCPIPFVPNTILQKS